MDHHAFRQDEAAWITERFVMVDDMFDTRAWEAWVEQQRGEYERE